MGERRGNNAIARSIVEFGEWVNDINLVDLPIVVRKFTWRKRKVCLDRIMINSVWSDKYPNLHFLGVKSSKSYHVPLLLDSKEIN